MTRSPSACTLLFDGRLGRCQQENRILRGIRDPPAGVARHVGNSASPELRADDGEAARAETSPVLAHGAKQAVACVMNVLPTLADGILRLVAPDQVENSPMIPPGLVAFRLGPDFEPARPGQPGHDVLDRLEDERIA